MKLNNVQTVMFKGVPEVKAPKQKETKALQTNPIKQAPAPTGEVLRAMTGVKPQVKKMDFTSAEIELEEYSAFRNQNEEDRYNITNVYARGDEESANVKMQLEMINKKLLKPATLKCYWETGKMCKGLAEDLQMMYSADKAGKNINDVYVPTVKSQAEGTKNARIGDVFQVENEKKIFVKTDDKKSKQLDMDKEMFCKLFPPAERFSTKQQSIGDCYLVSTLGTLMENKKARVALYDAIHQDGKDVTVKFKNGFGEYKYKNAELPTDRVYKYSINGATGIRLLEDAYGLDSVNKADTMFKKIMQEKIDTKKEELKTATGADKQALEKSIKGHEDRLNAYKNAKNDPSRTIVVCRDDNMFNIFYEEDENGLKFMDLKKDPDNKQDKFRSPADFYRGSLGGYNFEVLQRFGFGGFRQMNLDIPEDRQKAKEMMLKPKFNDNYIMTGGTRASGGRVENPVAESAGIFGFHAYTLKPHVDNNGGLKVTCTNPWNTAYNADVSYKNFLEYYDSVSVIDVNSYGKDLPLEKQPVPYDKDGAVVGDNKNDGEVIWYKNNRKPITPKQA